MAPSLTPFFSPTGVVVVGASTSPEKLGYGVARNLIESKYRGAIHFIGKKSGTLFGRPIHADLRAVPAPVDLAILIIPPDAMPETIAACGQHGIKAAIIATGGFREVGAEGAALEKKCVEIARQYEMRLLGPNCIGVLDTHLPFDTTFLQPPMPVPGGMGFISHSGAFCAAVVDWARRQGFGFSQLISLGNQADVNETDVLPEVAKNEHTDVILMYMEGVSDGRRFVKVAGEVTQRKPVIALKVGRFEAGQKAAASHTGALAGSESAFDAAFAKCGILRADTAEQMFDWARALAACPLPGGSGMAILTDAGGPGVAAADALETNGMQLSALSASTRKELAALLPASASVNNPVDMLASASPETYANCLKLLLRDENVYGVLVILPPPPMFKAEDVAQKLIDVIAAQSAVSQGKPVVIALMGSTLIETAQETFQRANIPTYPFPERAASALAALVKRQKYLSTEHASITEAHKKIPAAPAENLDELVAAYGIPTTPVKLARDEDKAVRLADEIGYPVVMKIASPDILHKSDVGGVILSITDSAALRDSYSRIIKRVQSMQPEAGITGVYIQRQVPQGQEVIVGMARDPLFGALMMFGSGGVEVEGLRDVAFALAPLNEIEAQEMIRATWAGRKLKGFRNIPPADESAVVDILIKLARLAYEHPELEEIEINPLRVLSKGAAAVDVRIKAG